MITIVLWQCSPTMSLCCDTLYTFSADLNVRFQLVAWQEFHKNTLIFTKFPPIYEWKLHTQFQSALILTILFFCLSKYKENLTELHFKLRPNRSVHRSQNYRTLFFGIYTQKRACQRVTGYLHIYKYECKSMQIVMFMKGYKLGRTN